MCLTEPIGPHDHLILAFITSRVPADLLETDVVIDAPGPDFASTGLRVSSTLQLHRLTTPAAVRDLVALATFPAFRGQEAPGAASRRRRGVGGVVRHHTRSGQPAAVVLSVDECEGLLETLEILADPRLRKGVQAGLEDISQGRIVGHDDIWG